MVTIRLPEGLAKYCDNRRTVPLTAQSVAGAIDCLVSMYPAAGPRVFGEDGRLRVHLMVLCNDQAVAADEMLSRELSEGDELALLFLAGGG